MGKEVLSHPNTSPKMLFRFRRTSQSPSERSVSSECQRDSSPTPKDRRHYCIQVRVMLGERRSSTPTIPCMGRMGGWLITDILQKAWPADCITEAVVLSPGEVILFFSRHSKDEGISYCRARNIEFGLGGPFNWTGRSAQTEALRKTMQEVCCVIPMAMVEKKKKAKGPG